MAKRPHLQKTLQINVRGLMAVVVVAVASLGVYFAVASHAATNNVAVEAENGTLANGTTAVSDTSASGGKYIQFGSGSTQGACTAPAFQTTQQFGTWNYSSDTVVNNNVWGPSGSWSQKLSACSPASWNVVANFKSDGGAIQSYPDTQFNISGKTIAQYTSLETCFGDSAPSGGEWDFAYDTWLNNFGIEIMVWNNWTDTGIYPPSGSRAVTIDGVGYHEFQGGGSNEWIYTRDTITDSGCFDMLDIFKDLVAHPSSSGITNSSTPNAIEYGVEIASTNGNETFTVNNATLTAN